MGQATGVWKELRKLTEHKTFYAVLGAADAAAEALREMPERLTQLPSQIDLAAISGRALEYVMAAGARVVRAYDELAERGMEVAGRAGPRQEAAGPGYAAASELARGPGQNGQRPGQARPAASRASSAVNQRAANGERPGSKPRN